MELDITGKVGIENALELLEKMLKETKEFEFSDRLDKEFVAGQIEAFDIAIEIVRLNLPVKNK